MINTFNTPRRACPYCFKALDRATGAKPDSTAPTPGDITVCLHCFNVGIFTDELALRSLTAHEYNHIRNNADIQRQILMLREACRRAHEAVAQGKHQVNVPPPDPQQPADTTPS